MTEAKVVSLPTQKEERGESIDQLSDHKKKQKWVKEAMTPFMLRFEPYDIPDEKLQTVIDFATDLFARFHTHMKEDRMLRKVVEHFKLKLIPQENEPAN